MPRVQTHREIALGTPLGDDVLLLTSLAGSEQLGRPFRFELDLVSEDHEIDFAKIVGQNVTIRLETANGDTRHFNGYVNRFAQGTPQGGLARYHATVVPWLWFLTRTADCRIFQEKAVPDIIKEVFRDHGFTDFQDALNGSYRTWEYCVQYRETDFNFISRLMEQEGIYYFFEHKDGQHVLVLADGPSSHNAFPNYDTIPFHVPTSDKTVVEHITDWRVEQHVQPGQYALNDFDFVNPKKALQAKATISRDHAVPDYEIFDYPGEYKEFSNGESYARIRLEELQAQFEVATGQSDVRGIGCGFTFTLTDHPQQPQNREYLVTSVHHSLHSDVFEAGRRAGEDEGPNYRCTFTTLDIKETYRPARITPKPTVQGPQTAIVVGKSGEEIWTDEHGRVKVLFHWDRYGKADENSSCWVRVSQAWAGKQWGGMFLPRIGQEVIVEFFDGDPDHPIITGRVYNGDAKPPYELPANKTMSGVKSSSSKGGAGFNEIRFEDKKDEEHFFVHAQKDYHSRVLNDAHEWIGNNKHAIVETDQMEQVKGDKHLTVDGDQNEKIGGTLSQDLGSDFQQKIGMNHAVDAGMEIHLKAGMAAVIEAGTSLTLKVGGNAVVIDSTGVTVKGSIVTIDGQMVKIASGPGSPAGSGSGCSPDAATAPEEALEAEPGKVTEPPEAREPPEPKQFSAAALVLQQASEDGTPFAEQCDKQPQQAGASQMNDKLNDPDEDGEIIQDSSEEDDSGGDRS